MHTNRFSNAAAYVDLEALRKNYNEINRRTGNSKIIAVVKANAYGHGVKECSRVFYECGCRFFAVANIAEALEVRSYLPDVEILILGVCSPDAAELLCDNNITVALGSLESAKAFASHVTGKKLKCHLKLDTGMNRIGFSTSPSDYDKITEAYSLKELDICGMFSHFACADMPGSPMTDVQLSRFNETKQWMISTGINPGVCHIANSAAALYRPDARLDYVRCGIILYGLDPSSDTPATGLIPAMSLQSHVSHTHILKKGESVGYGATFTADRDMELATIPVGYADGFMRAYANGGYVVINSHRCPIVGRICMDQFMVDATDADVKPGDTVVFFDRYNSVNNLATAAGTINYECVCLLSERVERSYTK